MTITSFECCSTRVDLVDPAAAITWIAERARSHTPAAVHLCNAYTLSLSRRDPYYADVLNAAELNLPDGTPLAWLGRHLFPTYAGHAVRGPTLLRDVVRAGVPQGLRHYLVGATEDVVGKMTAELQRQYPGVVIAGTEAPPFKDRFEPSDVALTTERASNAGADVVWVGLGTPKQDAFVVDAARRSAATFVAVGAAFDFIAGTKKEAPQWLHGSGLEWLFRFATEPRRLWRRYTMGSLSFAIGVAASLRDRHPHHARSGRSR